MPYKDPEKARACKKRWADAHPEHKREYWQKIGRIRRQEKRRNASPEEKDVHRAHIRAYAKNHYHGTTRDRLREYNKLYIKKKRYRKYGLTLDEFQTIGEKQNWTCPICLTRIEQKLCADHDHTTGKIRGVVCDRCNRGLGHFFDDFNLLERVWKYLESYEHKAN